MAIFAVVCILLISNGIKIIQSEPLDERSSLIVGISVVAAVATIVIPTDVGECNASVPELLHVIQELQLVQP